MKSAIIIFVGLFSLIYGGSSYYVGIRFLNALQQMSNPSSFAYWLFFALMSCSPFAARLGSTRAGLNVPKSLVRLGDYWMAALYYLFFGWLIVDLLRLITGMLPFFSVDSNTRLPHVALLLLSLMLVLLALGTINAKHTRVARYHISLAGQFESPRQLRAVMVSDVHLGRTIEAERLRSLVQQVNALEPDVIFLPGDIIDGDVDYYESQGMDVILSGMSAQHGVYAVLGNHEYLGGGDAAAEQLERAGVTVLRDQSLTVPGMFNVVGRDDRMSSRFTGVARRDLSEIISNIDVSLPIILLDHQPYDLQEAVEAGINLQLSGHTHYGQFFPNNLITGKLFEQDWGYLRKGHMHVVVSCGYGTWGPPIRLGSHSEIVLLDLTLEPSIP